RIEQGAHALARQQLAAGDMLGARGLAAAQRHLVDLRAQVFDKRRHRPGIGPEFGGARVEIGFQCAHGQTAGRMESAPIWWTRVARSKKALIATTRPPDRILRLSFMSARSASI